jgi:predicted PhzF superfamily epimerase YddE/YHI9
MFYPNEAIHFQTMTAGQLIVSRQKETVLYTLNFPARPAERVDLPESMLSALRTERIPVGVYKANDYLLVFENENVVKEFSPDFEALAKLEGVFAMIVTAPGDQVDFVSRLFAIDVEDKSSHRSIDDFIHGHFSCQMLIFTFP